MGRNPYNKKFTNIFKKFQDYLDAMGKAASIQRGLDKTRTIMKNTTKIRNICFVFICVEKILPP
jgi:hypothetical protein